MSSLANNKYMELIILTVSDAYEKWQDEHWTIPGNLLESTTKSHLSIYSRHLLPLIGKENVEEIDLDKIQAYFDMLAKKGYAVKTLKNITQSLDSLLTWCWMKRIINKPITTKRLIVFPKKRGGNSIKNAITVSEYCALNPFFSGHFKFALQFLAATGIRTEEIAIRKSNINFEAHVIYICTAVKRVYTDYKKRKTKLELSEYLKSAAAYRIIPMTPDIEDIVHKQMDYLEKKNIESEYLFCSSNGDLIDPRNILRAYHKALEKAHLPQRGLHSLRKMYIYKKVRSGMDPKILQKIVGHEDYTTTMKYYMNISEDDTINEAFRVFDEENFKKESA